MDIKILKLNDIKPYNKNAKKHPKEQIQYVANSISEFEWTQPLVIDENGIIIIGHCRYEAAKQLGIKELPCIIKSDWTEEKKNACRLADNKTNESDWDIDLLNTELDGIFDIDMSDFGFNLDFEEEKEIIEDDFDCELPEEPKAKLGDIYQLGNHRLMCGDSINENDIKKLVENNPIYLIYTDPPYGMNAVSKSGVLSKTYKTDIMNDDNNNVAIDTFLTVQNIYGKSNQIWWGANYYTECLPSSECWIVWDKNNGKSDQTDCELAWANFRSVVRQFTMASEKTNRVHPTQKPIKLFAEIIRRFDKNDTFKTVLDLFGGSGSTLIACEQLDRTCYIMELDPKYIDVIINRWEQFTGEKAVLLNAGR